MSMRNILLILVLPVGAYAQTNAEDSAVPPESGIQIHLLAARPKLNDAAFGVGQPFRPGILGSLRYPITRIGKRSGQLSTAIELAYREHKISNGRTTFYRADSYLQIPLLFTVSVPTNTSGTARFEPMIGAAAGTLANRHQIAEDSAGNIRRSNYRFNHGFLTAIASFGWAATSAGGTLHRFGFRLMTDGRKLFDNHKTTATRYDSYSLYYVFSPARKRIN